MKKIFFYIFLITIVSSKNALNQTAIEIYDETEDQFSLILLSPTDGEEDRNLCCLFASQHCQESCGGGKSCGTSCRVSCGYNARFQCAPVRCGAVSSTCLPPPPCPLLPSPARRTGTRTMAAAIV